MKRQRIIPVTVNILRKIMEIKFRHVHIAVLAFLLFGSVSISLCVLEWTRTLTWEQEVIIYLREKGYELERFPQVKEPDIESLLYEMHKDVPYYTDEQAWPITYFWDRWAKWPVRLMGGLMAIYICIRQEYDVYNKRGYYEVAK